MSTFGRLTDAAKLDIQLKYPNTGRALADQYGITSSSLESAMRRRGIKYQPPPEEPEVQQEKLDEKLVKALKRSRMTLLEVCERFDRTPSDVRAIIERLRREGFAIELREEAISLVTQPTLKPDERVYDFGKEHFTVGIISDTHLGSVHQQRTHLHEFMHWAVDQRKVDRFLHVGDLVDGIMRYPGSQNSRFIHAADAQRDYAVEHYPNTGVPTDIISGNHDHSFLKQNGFDVVSAVCEKREDMNYLGISGAYVNLNSVSFYLWHPGGGPAHAKSYRMQRQSWQGYPGGAKPDITLAGHWHFYNAVVERNVFGINVPCFQSQTPYELEKSLSPLIGGIVLEVWVDRETGRLTRVRHELVPFFVPIADDF